MALPEHLDYVEVSDTDDAETATHWWPQVSCTVSGCAWTYDADWSELSDDQYGADWEDMHPRH